MSDHQHRARRRLVAALALLFPAVCAASAAAGDLTIHRYSVLIEGEAAFAHHSESPGASGMTTVDREADFAWASEIPDLAFVDGVASSGWSEGSIFHIRKVSRRYHLANIKPESGECTGASEDIGDVHAARFDGMDMGAGAEPRITADLLPHIEFGLPNCTGAAKPTSLILDKAVDGATGPFSTEFEMPREAVGKGKIIQLLERRVTGADCPDHQDDSTKSCSLSWKATVTFTKTKTETYPSLPGQDDVPLVPIVPQPMPDDDLLVPLTAKARVTPKAAIVPISCPRGCSGRAVATPLGRGARVAGSAAVASKRFTVAPGGRTVVRLRFDRRAQRAVRRAGGVRIALSAGDQRDALTLRLKRR